MAYTPGSWISVVQNSTLLPNATPIVDLGRPFDKLQMLIPVINTGALWLEVAHNNTNFYPLGIINSNFITLSPVNVVGISAGNFHAVVDLFGHQFFQVMQSAAQNTNKTWQFRGLAT